MLRTFLSGKIASLIEVIEGNLAAEPAFSALLADVKKVINPSTLAEPRRTRSSSAAQTGEVDVKDRLRRLQDEFVNSRMGNIDTESGMQRSLLCAADVAVCEEMEERLFERWLALKGLSVLGEGDDRTGAWA